MTVSIDDIEPGMWFRYKGDKVPFVEAKNLIRDGKRVGVYRLPFFTDFIDSGRQWALATSSSKDESFEVLDIETKRIGKRGNELPDLIILQPVTRRELGKVGLLLGDFTAKFDVSCKRAGSPSVLTPTGITTADAANPNWGIF